MKTGKFIKKIRLDNPEVLAERKMKREAARTGNTRFPTAREKARTNALLERELKKEREELYHKWATASEDKQDLALEVAGGNVSKLIENFDNLSANQQHAVLEYLDEIANEASELGVNRGAKKFRETIGRDAWEANKQGMSGHLDVDESIDDLVNKKHKRLLSDEDTGEVFEPEFNHLDNASTNKQELIKLIQQQLTNSGEFVPNSSDQLLSAPIESLLKDNNQKRLAGMYKSTVKDIEKNRPAMLRGRAGRRPSSYKQLAEEKRYALDNYNRKRIDAKLSPVDEEGMIQAAANGDIEAAYAISHAKFKAADRFANKRESAIARSYEGLEGKADLDKQKIEYTRDGDGKISARNFVDDVFYGNDTDYQKAVDITKHDRLIDDTPLDPEADRFLRKEGKLKRGSNTNAYRQQIANREKAMAKYQAYIDKWEGIEKTMHDSNLSEDAIEAAKDSFLNDMKRGFKNSRYEIDEKEIFSKDNAPLSKKHLQAMLNKTKENKAQRPGHVRVFDEEGNLVGTRTYDSVPEMSKEPRFKDVDNKKLWQETPKQQLTDKQLERIEEARNRTGIKDADESILDEAVDEQRYVVPQKMSADLNENQVLALARRMQQAYNRAYPNKKLTTLNQYFIDKAIAEGNRPITKKTGGFTASKPKPISRDMPEVNRFETQKDYYKAVDTARKNRDVADFISSHMTRDRYNSFSPEERQKVIAEASDIVKSQKKERHATKQAERKARSEKAKDTKLMSTIPPSRREEVRARAKSFIKYGDSPFEAHQKAWAQMQQEDELAKLLVKSGPFKKTQLEEAYERLK